MNPPPGKSKYDGRQVLHDRRPASGPGRQMDLARFVLQHEAAVVTGLFR